MRGNFFICVIVVALMLASMQSARADTLVLGSNYSAQGASLTFVNPGPQNYLRLAAVDPHVNRLRIVDGRRYVFFDGHPTAGTTVYLPQGTYTATVWSSYGTVTANAITGAYTASAPQEPSPAARMVNSNAATSATSVQTGDYPPYYFNYYNYGYGNYNYNSSNTNLNYRHNELPRNVIEQQHTIIDAPSTFTSPSTLGPTFSPPSTLGPTFSPPSTLGF